MRQCSFIKANGERCGGTATASHGLCWAHAPENAAQRHRSASRAAKSKGSKELRAIKAKIQMIIDELEAGTRERGDASVMFQGYRTLKDFLELERKQAELDEIRGELEEIRRELRAG
jgi:hypothetical protein